MPIALSGLVSPAIDAIAPAITAAMPIAGAILAVTIAVKVFRMIRDIGTDEEIEPWNEDEENAQSVMLAASDPAATRDRYDKMLWAETYGDEDELSDPMYYEEQTTDSPFRAPDDGDFYTDDELHQIADDSNAQIRRIDRLNQEYQMEVYENEMNNSVDDDEDDLTDEEKLEIEQWRKNLEESGVSINTDYFEAQKLIDEVNQEIQEEDDRFDDDWFNSQFGMDEEGGTDDGTGLKP